MTRSQTAGAIAARIERLPFSRWHMKARLLIGAATFFDAFDVLAIAQVLPSLIPAWGLTPAQAGFIIAIGYAGQLCGALFFGWLAGRIGRLKTLAIGITIFSTVSALCGFAWDYHSLLVGRAVEGFGLGAQVPVAAVYFSEVVKAEGRGRFILLYECIFTVGLVLSGLIGSVVVPGLGWRAMFFIGALPILLAPAILAALPESPRWLASRGRDDEALAAIERIEREVEAATGRPLPPVGSAPPVTLARASWRDILGPSYLRRTLVVWLIWFASFLVTYGLSTWLPSIYRTVFDVPLRTALQLATVGTVLQLGGSLSCALVIDRIGRRRLFVLSFAGAALSLTTLGLLGAKSLTEVVVLGGFASFFAGSAAIGAYAYTPEIYPTRSRALGTSVGTSWLRLASMVGPLVVATFIGSGVATVFLVFAVPSFIASGIVALFGTETSGRALEELST